MQRFVPVLANTLIASVTSSYLWFALTFWAYLETRSVLATSIVGGSFMLLVAVSGMAFGVIVDPVSYTHLDVYKRQGAAGGVPGHLRQVGHRGHGLRRGRPG